MREMVDKVLSPMDGKCLVQQNTGWWWYKYCHKKEIVQFHYDLEKKAVGDEYVLGKHNPEASIEDGYEFNLDKMEYSETYTDGTVCDLTNKPRVAKVSFVCSPRTPEKGELVGIQVKKMHSKHTEICKFYTIFCVFFLSLGSKFVQLSRNRQNSTCLQAFVLQEQGSGRRELQDEEHSL